MTNTESTQPNCEGRIDAYMSGRLEDLRLMLASEESDIDIDLKSSEASLGDSTIDVEKDAYEYDDDVGTYDTDQIRADHFDPLREKQWEAFCNYGLCFDYVEPGTFGEDQLQGYFRYQLSWGGPSDEFRFFVNPDLSLYHCEYWFLDWFDGASRTVDMSTALYIYEQFNETGTTQHLIEQIEP